MATKFEEVKKSIGEISKKLPQPAQDKLSEIATQTGQPQEYFIGAAIVLVSLLTFLLLPPGFIINVVGVGYPTAGTLQCMKGATKVYDMAKPKLDAILAGAKSD